MEDVFEGDWIIGQWEIGFGDVVEIGGWVCLVQVVEDVSVHDV